MEQATGRDEVMAGGLAEAWPKVLEGVKARLGGRERARAIDTWLNPGHVRPCGIEDGSLVLECSTPMFQLQIRDRFADALREVVGGTTGTEISGVVCRVTRGAMLQHRDRLRREGGAVALEPSESPVELPVQRTGFARGFKMLQDFVVGDCNRVAFDAVKRIIDNPEYPWNPLFIHGSSGLGKTHLEQGLAVAFKERYPHAKIVYLTCEQFRNHYLSACERGTAGLQAFRVRLRHADLLLVDDIHFLSRGQMVKTQEELFSTFNELAERGKKVVITSDAHPKDIKYLEDRFIQRFTGGLVVPLDRPDPAVRREVVLSKSRAQGAEMGDEVVDFVADHITDNMRELEGAVNKVLAYANSFGRKIDLQLARQALSDLIAGDPSESRLKTILRSVADHFDLTTEDILGKGRGGNRPMARHIAMYVTKMSGSDTYAGVAHQFGHRTHSTVTYACEQVAGRRTCDAELDRFVEDLLLRVCRR